MSGKEKSTAATVTDAAPDPTHPEECARLRDFKRFLQEATGAEGGGGGGVGVANPGCTTRSQNETYPVSPQELHAELTMAVWAHLQTKRCPLDFQLALLRAAVAEVELQCRSIKDGGGGGGACVGASNDADCERFDLVKLQKFVINNLEKLLTRLTDNAEAGNLQNYADAGAVCTERAQCNRCAAAGADASPETPPEEAPSYVAGCVKNKPRKMEDRHVCLERYGELFQLRRPYRFYGVFDGHSGPLAASYAAHQLPHLLAERLRTMTAGAADETAYRDAFEASFMQADQMFNEKRINSGTTAVCALLTPGRVYVAWVGDSKALLVSGKVALQLVKPHKPDTPDERRRIETSSVTGGAVIHVQGQWRVNGILNVSRSIGDYSVGAVIAEPDFVGVDVSPEEHDFLVLATDGLWDHASEEAVVATIYGCCVDLEQRLEDIPKRLIELAKQGDSQDNITAVVVLLRSRQRIIEAYNNK